MKIGKYGIIFLNECNSYSFHNFWLATWVFLDWDNYMVKKTSQVFIFRPRTLWHDYYPLLEKSLLKSLFSIYPLISCASNN